MHFIKPTQFIRKSLLVAASIFLLSSAQLTAQTEEQDAHELSDWQYFSHPTVIFEDQAKGTNGSSILHTAMPDIDEVLKEISLEVCKQIYKDNAEARVNVTSLHLILKAYDGVAEKSGIPPEITLTISAQYLEDYFYNNGESYDAIEKELRGILSHEATHAFQWSPKNAGEYASGTDYYGFMEGLADYVRVQTFGFEPARHPAPGGSWTDGYEHAGFFIQWLVNNKDKDFAIKLNESARTLANWSWDVACQQILNRGVQELWNEYQGSLSTSIVPSQAEVVYPNPASSIVNIQSTEDNAIESIQLLSSDRTVESVEMITSIDKVQIDISALPNGYYILMIRRKDGTTEHRKLYKK